jgi:DNA-binding response OmpR family regulator
MATILVVEDDLQVGKLFHDMLTRIGHHSVVVSNGNEATRLFSQQSFDLVITDIFMPEKDGLEVIRELKTANPSVKVIAISGGGKTRAPIYLEMARKLGADQTLNKPFELKQLMRSVEDLLRERS